MHKKIRPFNILVCLAMLTSLLIFISPKHYTKAMLTDVVSVDAGITITLGNLDLALTGDNNAIVEANPLTMGSGVDLPVQILKNEGSLDGKIAYKVTVEGYDGTNQSELSFMIGNERIAGVVNSEGYQFLNGSAGSSILLHSGESINILPLIKSDSLSTVTEKMTVTISFLLVQTNATEAAEKMFYDKAESKNDIVIKSVLPNTSPAVWPTDGWQTNNNSKVKYNISDLTKTHYYGDSANNAGSLTFLDNPTIYLEFSGNKKDKHILENDLAIAGFGMTIVYDGNYADNGRVKIVYNLNEKKDSTLYLIKDVNLNLKFTGGNMPLYNGKIIAKKVILNTDRPDGLHNTQYQGEFPIYVANKSRSFYLSYIKADYSNDLTNLAKADINFSDYKMSIATSERYLSSSIDYLNAAFGLSLNASYNQTGEAGTAEMRITGNSNEPLVIRRAVKTLRTEEKMVIPEQWTSLSGGISIDASQLQLNLKTIMKDGKEYLVSDESSPPTLYFKNAGSSFFGFQLQGNVPESNGIKVKDVVYSPDLSIMKVTFSYAVPKGTSYDGFNINITNGVNPIVDGHYIPYSLAIQNLSLRSGMGIDTQSITPSEPTSTLETEGLVDEAAMDADADEIQEVQELPEIPEIPELLTEIEAAVESQNQIEEPKAGSVQPSESPIQFMVE